MLSKSAERKLKKEYRIYAEMWVEDFLPLIGRTRVEIRGDDRPGEAVVIRTDFERVKLWLKGTACVCCRVEGDLVRVEENHGNGPHANLYGVRDGDRVMLTRDHIVPKSRGGLNVPENYQLLCAACNRLKGDRTATGEKLRRILALRGTPDYDFARSEVARLRHECNPGRLGNLRPSEREARRMELHAACSVVERLESLA